MRLGGEILSNVYRLLNDPSLTNLINGRVYIGAVPVRSQSEDVEINLLTNKNQYIQSGYLNINVYVKHDDKGNHIKRIDQLLNIITSLIDNKSLGNDTFEIEGQSGYLRDPIRKSMSFVNLKIKFNTV